MENKEIFAQLADLLLPWYHANKRDLPWRGTGEPYHIWLSEIMLQQTRVEAVKGYYNRFLSALPTVLDLANADDELLHKLWEGLGYYSRVRNLKKAAIQIVENHSGVFPCNYQDVRKLPGIGDYTAGAVCSIAFNLPVPAVDGNVLRVISRLTDDATPIDLPAYKKSVAEALSEIYPASAGDFTQALMELGATVCGPNRKPDCIHCPLQEVCMGYKNQTAELLPVKSPKRDRKEADLTVLILNCGNKYALQKRPNSGLLAGLWQFPNCTGKLSAQAALQFVSDMGLQPRDVLRQSEKFHIFTHIRWNMRGIYISVDRMNTDFMWFTPEEIDSQTALPTAFRQFWEKDNR